MRKSASKVFLSYDRRDRLKVSAVSEHLRKAGFELWDPALDLVAGEEWATAIQKALRSCDGMIVFLSPDAIQSGWVLREIEYALGARHMSGRLISVMLKPTPKIPWILERLSMVRFEDPVQTSHEITELWRDASKAKPGAA